MFETSSLYSGIKAVSVPWSASTLMWNFPRRVKTDFILFFFLGTTATKAHGSPTHSISTILEIFLKYPNSSGSLTDRVASSYQQLSFKFLEFYF